MSAAEELREIVSSLKRLMMADREWGFEAPSLSPSALGYLEKGPGLLRSLEELRDSIGDCRRCKLWRGRTNLVFGEGSPKARLVFVGEGPGRQEDLEGRPFVGEAGKLLTKIIEDGMRVKREDVYICNIVKCRPPDNRDPEADEIAACMPFLKKQLDLIRPQVVCTLGRIAAQGLLGREFRITHERGKWVFLGDTPLMPTFHPAYLLHNPSAKRQVWEDVKEIMRHMGLEVKGN